jgi:LacI family transcriptional regulator
MMTRRPRATILDVAERAGVSVGTVSNVLNGTIRVSDRRQQRVLEAIDELSYSRNLLAHGLRRRSSPMIGLCVPHTSVTYFARLVEAFEEVAATRGYGVMQVLSHDDPDTEFRRVSTLLSFHVGGIILLPTRRPELTLEAVAESGTPLVVVDRPVAGAVDQVTFDSHAAMLEAAALLIGHGHRHILFLVRFPELATTRARIEALLVATSNARPRVRATILRTESYDLAAVTAGLRDALAAPDRPTAIITSNSTFAALTLRAFEELAVRCPDDVSLLAFDQPEWAELVTPKLSVVQQPTLEVARKAWEFLMRRMDDGEIGLQRAELQASVIVRGSVAGPARGVVRKGRPSLSGEKNARRLL